MILDPILPEIYTFIDFATHGCLTAKKKGLNYFSTHLAGDIPTEHPMPYNVYVPIREFLDNNSKSVDSMIAYIEEEFRQPQYNFKKVTVSVSKCSIKKSFGRSKEYPQIDVKLEW